MIIGHHIVLTGYGHWLPNDPRGSMSETIHAPDLNKLGDIHFGRKHAQPTHDQLREFYVEAQKHLHYPVLWWNGPERRLLAFIKHRLAPIPCPWVAPYDNWPLHKRLKPS